MPKRLRDEEILAANGGPEQKTKKQKQSNPVDDVEGNAPDAAKKRDVPRWKQAQIDKKKEKKELKRQKREKKPVRLVPKNLAKYGSTKEQKQARKLAKKLAAEALEARRAAKAAKDAAHEAGGDVEDTEKTMQPVKPLEGANEEGGNTTNTVSAKELKLTRKAAKKAAQRRPFKDDQEQTESTTLSAMEEDSAVVQPVAEEPTIGTLDNEAAAKAKKKALKRAEKAAKKAAEHEDTMITETATVQDAADEQTNGTLPDEAAAKAEKKAMKRAEKALKKAAKEKAETTDVRSVQDKPEQTNGILDETTAKAEAKALKCAAKAAKKAAEEKVNTADKDDVKAPKTNGHTDAQTSSLTYSEHPELSALPSSDITSFLESKQITVHNSGTEQRPITLFKYLPITEEQRAPFKGFTAPTPIQSAAWPYLLDGRDVIGVAETGSGKTLAFGVPCIRRLSALGKKERGHIRACIVSPTRELALQIQEQLAKFTAPFGLKVTCVYGGVNKDEQRNTLKGTHIVVATPGRLNDFIQEGSIDLSNVDYMVLDEADRMLDKGFEEDIRKIVSSTASTGRQTLMFTATWPPTVRDLASTFMTNPVRINIGDNTTGELRANTRIVQEVEVIEQADKQQRLFQLLKQYQSGKNKSDRILVFCLYKKEATRIEEFIHRKGFNVAGIHGDLSQQKRTESLEAFKKGTVPVLVATDVAARGLDIPAVKLVINVTFPLTAEDYVHRIGRTGRAGQDGKAITFFTDQEKGLAGALINVLKAANQPVPDELLKFGTTVKKKAHDVYGAFYKDTTDMKSATKITFD